MFGKDMDSLIAESGELQAAAKGDEQKAIDAQAGEIAADTYLENTGGFLCGDLVMVSSDGMMDGAVGSVSGFTPEGVPSVYISGMVLGVATHGEFIIPAHQLTLYTL